MSTARDLISGSLRLIGVLASGETPSDAEAEDALSSLNGMLDRWSANGLTIFNKAIEKFLLIPGQRDYTIGVGGDFDTSRPTKIQDAGLEIESFTPTKELPVNIVTLDQWANLIVKDIQSTIPVAIYPNDGFPFTTISVWPVPSAANKLVLYSLKPLSSLDLTTDILLPPGYADAIKYNMAVRLAPEYGKTLSQDVKDDARDALADVKRSNIEPLYLGTDSALHNRKTRFNWLIGE